MNFIIVFIDILHPSWPRPGLSTASAGTGFGVSPYLAPPPKSKAQMSNAAIFLLAVKAELQNLRQQQIEVPMRIGNLKVHTDTRLPISPPHDHRHILGHFSRASKSHVTDAINAALQARAQWAATPWEHRAAIFLRAADLLAGPYRARMNAATMLGQSKTIHQAEIDAVAEMCDFFRFNVSFAQQIFEEQPLSVPGVWNRLEYRPLEGFVFAITPFNFTSIAANLPAAPAMLGNVCVWKPADTQIYSAHVIMDLFEEAGLPAGVINLVFPEGPDAGDVVFNHPDFAGLHFTGSTAVFQQLWGTIGQNISRYKTYPRIVGETGGKDFVIAHPSADSLAVATALTRGAFEFQGQKCSAASRAYMPASKWEEIKKLFLEQLATVEMGQVEEFHNFMGAVIDERAFDRISGYIDRARKSPSCEIIAGGSYDKSKGYFIEPTVILCEDPQYESMVEEIFGPVLSVYIYQDEKWEETLDLVDRSSIYALTGAVFSTDRYAIHQASERLQNAAGNFYINDKPTGAIVGQQPFGGARGSGTNDKAGSAMNLYRWLSPRLIKETAVPPKDYRYPFMG